MYLLDFFYLIDPHQQWTFPDTNSMSLTKPTDATHILIQPMVNAVRYTLDPTTLATPTVGFWLPAGEARLLFVHGTVLNVAATIAGAIINYQWLAKRGG